MNARSEPRLELLVFAGESTETFPLPASGRVAIGRAEGNDVRVDHPSVSRRHAVLHLGEALSIEDLGGQNGTSVRDPRAPTTGDRTQNIRQISRASAPIVPGDTVQLGAVTIVVRRRPDDAALASGSGPIVAAPATQALWTEARLAARSPISVLILGETGAGKEVLARAIHDASPRAGKPFLGLNCAALSETLLESELFGHEKGAFTGAVQARAGLLESADGGTVFLDEVGELGASIQVKLLRVIELREVIRVGGRAPRRVDVRFVSATNRDLEAEAARGAFRQDLFFRLDGITLTVPPLRERVPEIAPLCRAFLARACQEMDRPRVPALSDEAVAALERYAWPGNVRELRNVIDRAVVLCTGDRIDLDQLPPKIRAGAAPRPPAGESPAGERARILAALEACLWNQTRAAEMLGVSRRTLINRIEEHGIPRPRKKA
ncbi:MAG: sigma 54-interacting transcriptional regulator [Minicystis sp.]